MNETDTNGNEHKARALLHKAVELQNAGEIEKAREVYLYIIQGDENNTDAIHNLGVLYVQQGNVETGLELLFKVWELDPENKLYWHSLSSALVAGNRKSDAIKVIDLALQKGLGSDDLIKLRDQLQSNNADASDSGQSCETISEEKLLECFNQGDHQFVTKNAKQFLTETPDSVLVRSLLVASLFVTGNFQEAAMACEDSLQYAPQNPEILNNYAVILCKTGDFEKAISIAEKALQLRPQYAEAYNTVGTANRIKGDLDAAVEAFSAAINLNSEYAEAYNNLGVCFHLIKDYQQSQETLKKAIELQDNYLDALHNLAMLYLDTGQFAEAEQSFLKAKTINPDYVPSLNGHATAIAKQGRFIEAKQLYESIISTHPGHADVYNNLGILFRDNGFLDDAESAYRQAINLRSDYTEAYSNLGILLKDCGRYSEAESALDRAISINPDFVEALNNKGWLYLHMGKASKAEEIFRTVLIQRADYPEAWNNLGNALVDQNLFCEADAAYLKALEISPTFLEAYSNRLFACNYRHDIDSQQIKDIYKQYGDCVTNLLGNKQVSHDTCSRDKNRKIRVGYLSPDFKGHACRFFIEPILRNHDKQAFEIFAYSNLTLQDQHTQRLKGYFDKWVDIPELSDEQVVACIVDDRIDILIDLAGHTRGNRLLVFGHKAAPVQASYMGYGYTTGLNEIDYYLCDKNLVPVGFESLFSEEPWRLPISACYLPPEDAPAAQDDVPQVRNGFVTFGCMTRIVRINDDVIRVWSEIIKSVEGSKLRLNQKPFDDPQTRELFINRFGQHGITEDQLILENTQPHWNGYNEFDLVLDPFPHNGGTTTYESIWMGVPVLTKMDRPSVGRLSTAVLRPLGLDSWITTSEEDYIQKAVAYASDIELLRSLRASLRQTMQESAIINVSALVASLEQAYRDMLLRWGKSSI